MHSSNPLNQFLATGQQPTTAREKSALLDQCRDSLLSTNQQTKIMQTIPQSMTAEFMTWKKTNPHGTAQAFTAWKLAGGKPSPTIAAHCGGLDPNNLPRLDNGKVDSLAITNAQGRQKQAEYKAASAAIQAKRPPGRIVINRSKYHKPD